MKDRRYIDFKLYVTRPAGTPGACQVALLPTPEVGETIVPVTVPAEKGPSQDQLAYLADKSITLRNLVALGKGLANWLLPEGTIRDLFAEALKRAGNAGGVRMRLIIADHEMKRWPWEYAYFDPLGGPDSLRGFLALEPRVSLVRHEPLPHPHPSPVREEEVPSDLRMLVVAASPKGQRELDLAREVRFIKKALKEFDLEGVRIRPDPILMDATPPEVAEALRGAGSAHIFHFVGHGIARAKSDPFTRGVQREEGYLFLVEDKDANTQAEVSADLLAKYLQQADVRLAVLGACYSGLRSERYPWDSVAGALVARDIPVVVSMQFEVIDAYAIAFSRAFYGALVAGLSLDEATALGRLAMFEEAGADLDQGVNLEWGVPVLYSRLPDGVVFPRLVERETETAKQMRNLIQQTVDTITETGEVVGIRAEVVDGAFQISQRAGTVAGTMIGVDADRVSGGRVEQDVDTVSGTVIGARLDELDF